MQAARSTSSTTAPRAASSRPSRRRSAGAAVWLREHPDEAIAFGQAGKAIAERVTWDAGDREAALVKVAIFSPMPPERSGIADYSALLLPALQRALRCRRGEARREEAAPRTDLCVYHVGNNPEAHGWIVEALRRTPGVVVLHDFVLHHLVAGLTIGRRDGHGYLDAMEREGGVVGRLLGHAVLDKRIPPLWENRPQDFHLAGEVLGLATGLDRPLPLRPRPRPGGGLRRADLDRPPSRLSRSRRARRSRSRAIRSSARSATSTRASAFRSCSRRSRACDRSTRQRALCSSAPPRRASTSTGGCSGSGSTATASSARGLSTRAGSGR